MCNCIFLSFINYLLMEMWIFDRLCRTWWRMGFPSRGNSNICWCISLVSSGPLITASGTWKHKQKDLFIWGQFSGSERKKKTFFCVLLHLLKKGRIHLLCENKAIVCNMAKHCFQLFKLDCFSVYKIWHGLFLSIHAHECLFRKE